MRRLSKAKQACCWPLLISFIVLANSTPAKEPPELCDNKTSIDCATNSAKQVGEPTSIRVANLSRPIASTTIATPKASAKATTPTPTKTTTTTTTARPDLITRTTGAIYNVLSSVFSFSGSGEDGEEAQKQPPTTTPVYGDPQKAPTSRPQAAVSSTTTTSSSARGSTPSGGSKAITTSIRPSTSTVKVSQPNSSPTQLAKLPQNNTNYLVQPPTQISGKETAGKNNSSFGALSGPRLYSMLGNALETIYSIRNAIQFLNRTTRLAQDDQESGNQPARNNPKSGKLILKETEPTNLANKQLASEDVHLLCKLLHNHLQSNVSQTGGNLISSEPSTTQTSQVTTTTAAATTVIPIVTTTSSVTPKYTTSKAPIRKDVPTSNDTLADLRKLNADSHANYLLRSVFVHNQSDPNHRNLIQSAERLLELLFNEASKLRHNSTGTSDLDYEPEPSTVSDEDHLLVGSNLTTDLQTDASTYFVRRWPKETHVARGRLQLVYWLIKQVSNTTIERGPLRQGGTQFKLISAPEAQRLLDELDRSLVKRQLDRVRLNFIGDLVANFSQKSNEKPDHESQPHVIDEEQIESAGKPTERNPKSGLQLLLERLSDASFVDNFHLHLIIFIVVLFVIILCFVVPMLCCRPGATPVKTPAKQRRRRKANTSTSVKSAPALHESSSSPVSIIKLGNNMKKTESLRGEQDNDEKLVQLSDSIWRKLSSSTTTLVKDQSELMRSDGTIAVPVVREEPTGVIASNFREPGKRSQFGWYSFEDRFEEEEELRSKQVVERQSQTYIVSSDKRRQTSKSVQTSKPDTSLNESNLNYQDRFERKSSDTLTKSELVLMKEKLVPIAQQHQQHTRQVASQTSDPPEPVYVNQFGAGSGDITRQQVQSNRREQTERQQQHELSQAGPSHRSGRLISSEPSRYIDSTESRPNSLSEMSKCDPEPVVAAAKPTSDGGQMERIPKMRHLELPPRTRSKVDAIKAELSKLEERDQRIPTRAAFGEPLELEKTTYKRFDVI